MEVKLLQFLMFCSPFLVCEVIGDKKLPHVVFLLADDLGYNDVGYSRFSGVRTPFLTELASRSLILNHSYTPFVCSPSRAAIMTGKYPYRYGMQKGALLETSPDGLDMTLKLLPQYMHDFGYQTHLVGKWHLGLCKEEFTPLKRGFDTFHGFLNGVVGYYDHIQRRTSLLDYWHNWKLNKTNVYSTDDFAKHAVDLINNNEDPRPMFLYLSLQAIHTPLDVPPNVVNVDPSNRRSVVREMIKTVDRFTETVVNSLKARNIWRDTVFVFTSDNGGRPAMGGSNYPLRGVKHTLWEGGARVRSFVHGGGLPRGSYTGLFHAMDWLPTIAGLTGNTINDKLDGVDQSAAMRRNAAQLRYQPRKSFFYNVDTKVMTGLQTGRTENRSAVRYRFHDQHGVFKDFKLILGNPRSPSTRIHPDLYINPLQPKEEIYFTDGVLYDMTVSDCLVEETPLEGHGPARKTMKAMIQAEMRNGWMPYVESPLAFTLRDGEGNAYLGPGWC